MLVRKRLLQARARLAVSCGSVDMMDSLRIRCKPVDRVSSSYHLLLVLWAARSRVVYAYGTNIVSDLQCREVLTPRAWPQNYCGTFDSSLSQQNGKDGVVQWHKRRALPFCQVIVTWPWLCQYSFIEGRKGSKLFGLVPAAHKET